MNYPVIVFSNKVIQDELGLLNNFDILSVTGPAQLVLNPPVGSFNLYLGLLEKAYRLPLPCSYPKPVFIAD